MSAPGRQPSSYPPLVANQVQVNRLALVWLKKARAQVDHQVAYLPQLAMWGIENQQKLPEALAPNHPSPSQVEHRLLLLLGQGQQKAEAATNWFLNHPHLTRVEQTEAVLHALQAAKDPEEAAAQSIELAASLMIAAS